MKKILQLLFVLIFIFGNGYIGYKTVLNHNTYSKLEERNLSTFEELTNLNPLKKEFFDHLTNSFSDQVYNRNGFVRRYFNLNVNVLHRDYVDSVVIGKDNYLFGEPFPYRKDIEQEIENIANLVNDQANKIEAENARLIYISYPRKDALMNDYLPSFYNDYRTRFIQYNEQLKSLLNDNVIFIDLIELLEQGPYYYRGDHHLNIEGQQILYEYLNEIMIENKNPKYELSDYSIMKAIVEGSFDRKIAYQSQQYEENLFVFPQTFSYDFNRYENGKLSDLPIMSNQKKYAAFMSGDRGETRIVNHHAVDEFKLLFSGSSYLNSLEFLYIPSVSSFISLDYRHNVSDKSVIDYVKEFHPNYVIYTASTSVTSYGYENHLMHFGLKPNDEGE